MTLKILSLFISIPLLFFALGSRAKNTRETYPLQQDSTDSQDTFSKDALNQLQDIHNFESIFDDSQLEGMFYEGFK